jgi:hypothetical protein
MKQYAVTVEATDIVGTQVFAVMGEDEQDAKRNYRNGEVVGIIGEYLEVIGLDSVIQEVEESEHISDLPSDIIAVKDERIKELEEQKAELLAFIGSMDKLSHDERQDKAVELYGKVK